MEEEKKKLKVDNSSSKSINGWRVFFTIVAWISLFIGFISTMSGLQDLGHSWFDPSTLITGLTLLTFSIAFFITSVILKGLRTITEASEYKKALVEKEYEIDHSTYIP